MSNKGKAILFLLACFVMLSSLAFAQEDIFVGTWQGRLSGEGLEILPFEDFETGFKMDIVNLKVSQASPDERGYVGLPFSGWATVHYKTPKWIPKEDTPIHYSNFKVETVSGKIDGGMWVHYDGRYSEAKSLSLDYSEVRPVITYTVTLLDWPPYTAGGTHDILGVMFDVIYSSPDLELTVVAMEDNSIKLNFEYEFIPSGYKVKVNGVLYRVDIERD